jgi:hypothetical protein
MTRLTSRPLLLLAGLAIASAVRSPGADAPVVLPKVVVTGTSLEEREHWRYAQVGGYEILSQASDAKLQQLAQELELLPLITKAVWPGPVAAQQSPTAIVMCDADRAFVGFIPENVRQAINPMVVDRVFLGTQAQEAIVFDCDKMGDAGRFNDILRDYVRRCFLAMKQPPPDWFITGMTEIIVDADYQVADGQMKIHYAGLDRPPRGVNLDAITAPDGSMDLSALGTSPPPTSLYETEKPSPAVRAIIRGALDNRTTTDLFATDPGMTDKRISHQEFNAYFHSRPFHSNFEDILKNKPSVNPDEYRMTCWAFVHLCAFGEQRRYGAAFARFLQEAGKNPEGDMVEMFRAAFGKVAKDMEIILSDYCNSASSLGLKKTVPCPEFVPPVITDANPMLIGRVKAEAYRLGGHDAEADAEMAKARHFTHVEPPVTTPSETGR